jgi:protein-tyrosine-phosphatase
MDMRALMRIANSDGIKTTELDSVKTRIMSDATFRNDFDACVTLCKDLILQLKSAQGGAELNIFTTETSHKGTSADVADRYYNKEEYSALSNAQKDKLREKGLMRRHKSGSGGSRSWRRSRK